MQIRMRTIYVHLHLHLHPHHLCIHIHYTHIRYMPIFSIFDIYVVDMHICISIFSVTLYISSPLLHITYLSSTRSWGSMKDALLERAQYHLCRAAPSPTCRCAVVSWPTIVS